ncbi:MAG: hypothetical protein OMM_09709, partial [Candidatus Magnetoglobus multicellularis str. Araruama]
MKLIINNDGTITDVNSGLMWQQDSSTDKMTWEKALEYSENLSMSGYDDWRLPTIKELRSIAVYSDFKPIVDEKYFHGDFSFIYWSSTTDFIKKEAWGDYFGEGSGVTTLKSNSFYARTVRGGQYLSSENLLIWSPEQASIWQAGDIMKITWDTQSISDDVIISISRKGGKNDTFIPISNSTPNDGEYEWIVTNPPSVNCMLRIAPLSFPDKVTTQGLFTIINTLPSEELDKQTVLSYSTGNAISENVPSSSIVAYLTSRDDSLTISDSQFDLEELFFNNWILKTSPTYNLNNSARVSNYYYYTITVVGETGTENFALKILDDKIELDSIPDQTINEDTPFCHITLNTNIEATEYDFDLSFKTSSPSIIASNRIYYSHDIEMQGVFHISLAPTADANGVAFITITVMNEEKFSASTTFELNVLPVNDPPEAFNTEIFTTENCAINGQLYAEDKDGTILSYSIVTYPVKGEITITNDGAIIYTPTNNLYGEDTFEYKVYDNENAESNTAIVSIFITPNNTPPVVSGINTFLDEDKYIYINLIASDPDNDPITYHILTNPTHGTISLTDETVLYTPNPNYNGPDSFTYKVNDGLSDSNTAKIMITIYPVYDIPQASFQQVTTSEGMPVNITLTGFSPDNKSLTYQISNQPTHGVLSQSSPYLTYTPDDHFYGTDEFTYIANDGISDSLPATVSLTVARSNTYVLNFLGNGYGTFKVNSSSVLLPQTMLFQAEQEVCFEAIPDTDWRFINWTGDLQSTENPICIIMDQNKTITANMEIKTFLLSIDGSEPITINNALHNLPFSKVYEIDTHITLENTSEFFNCWESDLQIFDNPYTFSINSDMAIIASFFPVPDWQSDIHVERLVNTTDVVTHDSVIIGAASQAYSKSASDLPDNYSCHIVLNNQSLEAMEKDIRQNNHHEYQWIIAVDPHGNADSSYIQTTATITWDPNTFSSEGHFLLKSMINDILIPDMRQTTEYQFTDNSYVSFKIIWKKL